MKLVPFIADNAAAALVQIQERLGPDAVVVSVRKLPVNGISRLWNHSGKIEVMACVPDETDVRSRRAEVQDQRSLDGIRNPDLQVQLPDMDSPVSELPSVRRNHSVPPGVDAYVPFGDKVETSGTSASRPVRRWQSVAWLESLGLLNEFAGELEEKLSATHGDPPPMPIDEWRAIRACLASYWRPARHAMECTGRPHVFVGPPGSGKTTVLCKWMTLATLMQERSVRVWRLDSSLANTAEFLSLHCEMLGLEAERFWSPPLTAADLLFVDLPGIESRDTAAFAAVKEQLSQFNQPHVHLVLNAACETSILFEQVHAFASLMPEDIVFTHLDEEHHRVKLWNFVIGKKFPISFLSAGQKIPGEFSRAEAQLLFPR